MRGRCKIGLKVNGLCTSRHLTQYLPTGVSTVRIRLRRSFPLLVPWCSILVLGHFGVTVRSSELPLLGLPRNQKEKKSCGRLQDFSYQKLKIEQVFEIITAANLTR